MAELRRLTTSGKIVSAQLSPDGKMLAYDEGGVLYAVALVPGSRPLELSRDARRFSVAPPGRCYDGCIRWMPDNARLLVRGDSGLSLVPVLGGELQRVAGGMTLQYLSLSPDGRYALQMGSAPVAVVTDIEKRTTRRVTVQGNDAWYYAQSWAPDGEKFVLVTDDGVRRYRLQVASVETGKAQVILTDSVQLRSPRWDASTRSIVYLRATFNGSQVWRLPVTPAGAPAGRPRLVMPFIDASHFELAEDGRHLVFPKTDAAVNYFVRRVGEDTTRRRVTDDNGVKPAAGGFSPDGRRIAFVQMDANGYNIFVAPTDSGRAEQVTFMRDRAIDFLMWSPTGRTIAFCGRDESGQTIGLVTVETRVARDLPIRDASQTCHVGWLGTDAIAYQLPGNQQFAVHNLRTDGTRSVTVDTNGWVFRPVSDSGGSRFAFDWNRRRVRGGVHIANLPDTATHALGRAHPLRFTGDTLYASGFFAPAVVRVVLGAARKVDTLRVAPDCNVLDVSPDASRVLCRTLEWSKRDLWIVRNFDPQRPAPSPARP